jgi:hypothetical protein
MSNTFNPISTPQLSNEARKVVNAAFDAMTTWRTEIQDGSEEVIEKMAEAARALGWPKQIVDTTTAQMQSVTKMQVQAMDQIMDVWQEQIKSPNPSVALSKLKSLPSFGLAGGWPFTNASQMAAMNPFGIYLQVTQQWQKAWADGMAFGPKLVSDTAHQVGIEIYVTKAFVARIGRRGGGPLQYRPQLRLRYGRRGKGCSEGMAKSRPR